MVSSIENSAAIIQIFTRKNRKIMISPIDSRYHHLCKDLDQIFSHENQVGTKIWVSIEYLKFICKEIGIDISDDVASKLDSFDINNVDMDLYRDFEAVHNHDTRAVVEYVKHLIEYDSISKYVHFGLTSEDICSVTYNRLFNHILSNIIMDIRGLYKNIINASYVNKDNLMIARTHGQMALPTTLGDTLAKPAKRIGVYLDQLKTNMMNLTPVKFGGAIGNLVAHSTILGMNRDKWLIKIGDHLLNKYGMVPGVYDTQVDYYAYICDSLNILKMIALIIDDLSTDMWLYASIGNIAINSGNDTGSSTMTHKSNPIAFENAMTHSRLFVSSVDNFVNNMSKSMMYRDLTSSSLIRYLGVIMSYFRIMVIKCDSGMNQVVYNSAHNNYELDNNYQVLAEYVQLYIKHNYNVKRDVEAAVKRVFKYNKMDKNSYVSAVNSVCSELGVEPDEKLLGMDIRKYLPS